MSAWLVILTSAIYLGVLFGIAYWGDYRAKIGKSLINNPYAYSLSLAVFCTAWTYYGSVGLASQSGMAFLTTYTGPALVMPLWWVVMRKIVRICRVKHLATIADFISSRYGKSMSLGILVTLICILAILPYLALQLKALSESFLILTQNDPHGEAKLPFFADTAFYLTLTLLVFNIWFGTHQLAATDRHEGMVAVIVVESVLKLIFFVLGGLFVIYFAFDGWADIFQQTYTQASLRKLLILEPQFGLTNWFFLSILSAFALLFLPRVFQMAVVENINEKHLKKATWLFPLYLWLINILVLPVALGGRLLLGDVVNADMYLLHIPLHLGQNGFALLVYLGGLSAGTSMIIVALMALNVMISNNMVMPLWLSLPFFQNWNQKNLAQMLIFTRRVSIGLILLGGYIYFRLLAHHEALVSIGLISFGAVAQFAPAVIGGIYWKRGNKIGAWVGISLGFLLWMYLLVTPSLVNAGWLSKTWLQADWGSFEWLKPYPFLGLNVLDGVAGATFWCLMLNTLAYMACSITFKQTSVERNHAEIFVDIFDYDKSYESAVVWKGKAPMSDLIELLGDFLGEERTLKLLDEYTDKFKEDWRGMTRANANLINYAEKNLAGVIGTVSARKMIASSFEEDAITRRDVYEIFRESQELMTLNKLLNKQTQELEIISEELKSTNRQLKRADELKNEFISTVTHEMRTPITSIRAFSEILFDNPDLSNAEKQEFLNTIIKETNRMERLINQVLELEKFESGKQKMNFNLLSINEIASESVQAMRQMLQDRNIELIRQFAPNLPEIKGDKDRLMQVMINLLSNAIKFCPPEGGKIVINIQVIAQSLRVSVEDNGRGIKKELFDLIFEKFYQAENQNIRKPKGSGLGLAICKKIIQSHKGKIWVESEENQFTRFTFALPLPAPIEISND
ncbi:MAG: ATP-binding protein [Microscillaceae bacterium]|jgi:signal transduction histidine kinase/Na+/proline symporter|nr:ATP-binding protein [Microscillaceae bacterium]